MIGTVRTKRRRDVMAYTAADGKIGGHGAVIYMAPYTSAERVAYHMRG